MPESSKPLGQQALYATATRESEGGALQYGLAMPALRVRLFVPDLSMLEAAIDGADALSRTLGGYEVAEGWEVVPETLPAQHDALAEDSGGARWGPRPKPLATGHRV